MRQIYLCLSHVEFNNKEKVENRATVIADQRNRCLFKLLKFNILIFLSIHVLSYLFPEPMQHIKGHYIVDRSTSRQRLLIILPAQVFDFEKPLTDPVQQNLDDIFFKKNTYECHRSGWQWCPERCSGERGGPSSQASCAGFRDSQ